MEEADSGWGAWRSPRVIAAAACFLLGAALLGLGIAPRLGQPVGAAPLAAEPLALDEALDPDVVGETQDDTAAELVVYVSGAVRAPDVYRLPPGARVKDAVLAAGGLRDDAAGEQVNLAEPVSDAQQIHVPARSTEQATQATGAEADDGLLDLNRASTADLEELPGVGAVLAGRIVARRDEQGPYATLDDLREVSGVGSKLFEQIAPLLKVGG